MSAVSMKRYLLSIYQPDGPPPPHEVLKHVMEQVEALTREMRSGGAWLLAGGLHPPTTATVVRLEHGDVLMIDGPYVESKEHIGGFVVIQAPDLDAALEWRRWLALATTLPIEVRPFQESPEE
jgi:hypothetical protein